MPLIYAFVSRDATVLADYTAYTGNFSTVAVQCLEKCPTDKSKFTFTCDGHTFNYMMDEGFTFLAVADEASGRPLAFAFLDKIRQEFLQRFADKGRTASAHSLDKQFRPLLKKEMEFCTEHPQELTKTAAAQKQVDEVQNIMVKNIESVLERGEKIDVLLTKSDNLSNTADRFQKTGRQLRSKMWWQNMKMKLLVVVLILVLIFVIVLIVCFSGANCIKH